MSVLSQKTLKKKVKFEGIGLHTGKQVLITILPSSPNTGIIFKRIDLKKNNTILPNVYNVSNATLCTTITNEYGVSVSTIEHLMGALYGLGIDNALIEINSQEVPIMDGSARIFVEKFLETGFEISEVPIKLIKITNEISLKDGVKYISIGKSNVSLDIDFEIKYSNSLIGNQKNKINVYEDNLSDIYNSRTFCLYEDVENLRNFEVDYERNLAQLSINKGLFWSFGVAMLVSFDVQTPKPEFDHFSSILKHFLLVV